MAAGTGRVQRGAPGPVLALSTGQGIPSGSVLPALHANPAGHCPVQDAFTMASESPYLPAGHLGQTANPPGLKRPAGHTAPAVLLLELLAGQAYPGAQGPLHPATGIAVVFPKRPAGHGRQTGSWLVRYVPTAHATAVALELPAGQKCPSAQSPLQVEVLSAVEPPYTPAGHSVHCVTLVAPVVVRYVPAGHGTDVALVEPAEQ